jgi:predicted metal-binding protein
MEKVKIGIIICDRYKTCAGGKCFRAAEKKEGALSVWRDTEIEIAGFTSCGGCPGGNIEYAPEEMAKNGVTAIHFATGLLVGYPPCPYMEYFRDFIVSKYGMKVIFGTHPVPQKYFVTHSELNTWNNEFLIDSLQLALADENTRLKYD